MRPVLLLVDLQNDFLEAPGLEPTGPDVVRRAARLLEGARARGVPVVHVMTSVDPAADDRMPHWKTLGLRRCLRGTRGHSPPAELTPADGEPVITKTFFSAFSSVELAPMLAAAEADTLLVAGVHLHGCVRATVLDAYQRGFAVWVADDAVGSDDPLHGAATRRYLEGRAARFAPVSELLGMLSPGWDVASEAALRLPAAVIAGRHVHRDGLPVLLHRSPRQTSERLFTLPAAGATEAAEAAAAARESGRAWRETPPGDRARRLVSLAELLESDAPGLARELAVDVGKPVTQGEAEVRRAAMLLRNAAASPVDGLESCGPGSAFRRVPVGVIGVVTPWNNPVAIPWGKIAPALAHGNAVVWKPAPAATRLALRTIALGRDAGLPDGLVNVVAGDHRTAAAVMSDRAVDGVSLSGSSLAGWAAQEVCARRRIPLQAELGGNNAAIVWGGTDLARAALLVASGAFAFAGQRCTANRRVILDARLFDEFLRLLTRAIEALVWGDPMEPATQVGPLVSEEARERVASAVERARASADRVLAPHDSHAISATLRATGAYYPPTLVVGAAHDSEIVQEETFGPVLVIERAESFEEALALANGVRQGLVASLFSGAGASHEQFLAAAKAGILKWNASTADADAFAPFGGWKASGVGPPEHGPGDAEFYARLQAIYGGGVAH